MKKRLFSLALVLGFAIRGWVIAQVVSPAIQQVQVDVTYLSSDLLRGREAGTSYEQLAAQYIASRFKALGLKPAAGNNSYEQVFDFTYKSDPHGSGKKEARKGRNVVGFLDHKAKNTVVIGAHFDHLGMGHFSSLHTGGEAIHNGADDNASGVACMLYLAERLKDKSFKKNNYLFVAFSAEELGLVGSKYFAEHLPMPKEKINYMFNMDMVGRLNAEKVLAVMGTGTSPTWNTVLANTDKQGLQLKTSENGIGPSDHTSFYLIDLPVLAFFTGQHTDYHKPSDDAELLNFDGIAQIGDLMLALIAATGPAGKLAFTKTKDENENKKAASFKVTLGVLPDYVFAGDGMRIDGVLDGRPAAAAGLLKGDVIIKLGTKEVKTVYDYMEGLAMFKAGESTEVVVLREGKTQTFKVTF